MTLQVRPDGGRRLYQPGKVRILHLRASRHKNLAYRSFADPKSCVPHLPFNVSSTKRNRMVTVTSMDLYLRIRLAEIDEVRLLHLHSEVDRSIVIGFDTRRTVSNSQLTGYTEWTAAVNRQQLSLGWDWYEMEPGVLAILQPGLLRTNVMLVDEWQRDLGRERTNICLLGLIRNTDWYTVVADYVGLPPSRSRQN